ncbi:MAG TPA: Pvc16 family protein [Actinomycetes bacterium]
MFDDLDRTLRAVLHDAAAPQALRDSEVAFETPGKSYAPGQATLNLFLHQIQENVELRDPAPIVERSGNGFVRRQPPLRVRCTYLVTAWSEAAAAADKVSSEHRLLGLALVWLRRFPVVPAGFLQGDLAGQQVPPPTLVARPDGARDVGEFWSALGIPPRPALDLSVTIGMELGLEQPEGPPVVTAELRLPPDEPGFHVAGTVRRADTLTPVAGARVVVTDTGLAAVADAQGRFRLSGLTAGSHTLRTSAAGLATTDTPVVVPATAPTGYDISLSP